MNDQVKISEIDARILKMLMVESRTSFTDIADQCEITVAAVRMRYKHLWDDGIINGEKMLVNPHCLGFRHIVDLGIECAVGDEKEVSTFLEIKPYISEVIGPRGKYNFYGKTALRDLNKLREIIEDLKTNSKIKHVESLIWEEAINIEYPENLIIKPLNSENESIYPRISLANSSKLCLEIDETDKKIAKILSDNSRTPFNKIAEDLDLSPKTIMQRYKKLRQTLLTKSSISVDLEKLGYKALANAYLTVSNRGILELFTKLLEIPNLIVIIKLIGPYDLYCAIAVEDFSQLFEVTKKIRNIGGVDTVSIFLSGIPRSWPLNLFPSLLENEYMQPKYWPAKRI